MPRYVFQEELIDFIRAEGIVLDPYQPDVKITEFGDAMNDSVIVRCKLYGRVKTEDEKYSDCLEYMISNL